MTKGLKTLCLLILLTGCNADYFKYDASAPTVPCTSTTSETSISGTANMALWLDAQDLSTTFGSNDCSTTPLSADGPLGCWKDKSGQARHFIQATAGKRPALELTTFENLNSISFSSASQTHLSNNTSALFGNSGNTFFIVMEVPASDGERQVLDTGSVAGVGSRRTLSVDWVNLYYASNVLFYHQANYLTNRVVTVVEDGASSKIMESGNSVVTTGAVSGATASGLPTVLGSRFSVNQYFIDNKIAELVVFNAKLSDAEILAIQSHLACKYNL